MDLTLILLTTLVVAVGVGVGSAVQKMTHFIDPLDFITLLVVGIIFLHLIIFDIVPWHPVWDLSFFAGYAIGYAVAGHTKYTMVRIFLGNKHTISEYWVIYYDKNGTYRQEQSNIALAKRLFFGIKHEIICLNGDMEPDWIDTNKYPHFPEFKKSEIMVETYETYIQEPGDGKRHHLKRYITEVMRANGSIISTVDLIRDRKAVNKANGLLIDAQNENFRLKQSQSIKMADNISFFLSKIYNKAPGASFVELMDKWKDIRSNRKNEDKIGGEKDVEQKQ
ncbi:MAG: hypothetical protein RBR26_10580 [Methanosarcina mazei]|nr:hypothetical protein [Methanosarcina mazei]